MMKAVLCTKYGPPDVLKLGEVEEPDLLASFKTKQLLQMLRTSIAGNQKVIWAITATGKLYTMSQEQAFKGPDVDVATRRVDLSTTIKPETGPIRKVRPVCCDQLMFCSRRVLRDSSALYRSVKMSAQDFFRAEYRK